jgi:hypothetical protein
MLVAIQAVEEKLGVGTKAGRNHTAQMAPLAVCANQGTRLQKDMKGASTEDFEDDFARPVGEAVSAIANQSLLSRGG